MPKSGASGPEKKKATTTPKSNSKATSSNTLFIMLLSAGVLSVVLAYLSFGPVSPASGQHDMAEMDERGCPIYTQYSMEPHGDRSSGPLALPFMRPEERCRTFNSTAVEVCPFAMIRGLRSYIQKVIQDMKDRLKDPDLARLFENTFPSTLDTTVSYFNSDENVAFIITGVNLQISMA
jgi:hypothetical protein